MSSTTAVASTSTSTTMTPTTTPAVPPAVITEFDTANGRIHIAVATVSRSDLHVQVTVQAIGIEEGTTTVALPVGVVDQSVVRALDPDSRYTFRVGWSDPSGLHGPEDTRIVEPVYPQPYYRGPTPVGGPGWSVLFTNEFVPTRRNPCAPIQVHYDPTNAPLDLLPTIRAALVQASTDSGVEMTVVSTGKTRPADPRTLEIDWVSGTTNYLGLTRQTYLRDARGVVWRTSMGISLAASRRVATGRWQTVLLHEFGHVLGLQHSHDDTSMMYSPVESGANWPFLTIAFNEGDALGLHAMNAAITGGCSATIVPSDLWNGTPGP